MAHLDGLVVLVSLDFLSELFDDDVVGVDFKMFLSGHVTNNFINFHEIKFCESFEKFIQQVKKYIEGLTSYFYSPHGGGILESLSLHNTLHVGGPTVLAGNDIAW